MEIDEKVRGRIEEYVRKNHEGLFKNKEVHIMEKGSVYYVSSNIDASPLIFKKSTFED